MDISPLIDQAVEALENLKQAQGVDAGMIDECIQAVQQQAQAGGAAPPEGEPDPNDPNEAMEPPEGGEAPPEAGPMPRKGDAFARAREAVMAHHAKTGELPSSTSGKNYKNRKAKAGSTAK